MPEHDESDPLQPKKTTSLGRFAVAAAAFSFLLGAAAATAVRGSGLRGSDLHETVETSKSATTLIKLASDPTKCITVHSSWVIEMSYTALMSERVCGGHRELVVCES